MGVVRTDGDLRRRRDDVDGLDLVAVVLGSARGRSGVDVARGRVVGGCVDAASEAEMASSSPSSSRTMVGMSRFPRRRRRRSLCGVWSSVGVAAFFLGRSCFTLWGVLGRLMGFGVR